MAKGSFTLSIILFLESKPKWLDLGIKNFKPHANHRTQQKKEKIMCWNLKFSCLHYHKKHEWKWNIMKIIENLCILNSLFSKIGIILEKQPSKKVYMCKMIFFLFFFFLSFCFFLLIFFLIHSLNSFHDSNVALVKILNLIIYFRSIILSNPRASIKTISCGFIYER